MLCVVIDVQTGNLRVNNNLVQIILSKNIHFPVDPQQRLSEISLIQKHKMTSEQQLL